MQKIIRKFLFCVFIISTLIFQSFKSIAQKKELYEIKIYHFASESQVTETDQYLRTAFLPALHRMGINKVGVFKPINNDTASDKKTYLLIPFHSADQIIEMPVKLEKDLQYNIEGRDYLNAQYNNPPYTRTEIILLEAFDSMAVMQKPNLTTPDSERIYELRSYEGPTENIHANKMQMFNKGGEFDIFKRLNFNIVFCGEVLSGSHIPNLMYMPAFDNMASHDTHWKNFGNDPQWKTLSAMPQYQNNVSHIDAIFLHPANYSDF